MDSSRKIEDDAAEWLRLRDGDGWSSAEALRLEQWLQGSIANRVAFLRLEAAWEHALRLKALGAGTAPGLVPPRGNWQVSPLFDPGRRENSQGAVVRRRHGVLKVVGLAASLVAVLGAAYYLGASRIHDDRYATPVGGMASIPLPDGTNVTLNTGSNIRVALTETERLVEIEGGEAFFDVAKDAGRPFVVQAGDRRIVAVGTRFSVRRDADDLQVVVTDGKVRVETDGEIGGVEAVPMLLAAGSMAQTASSRLVVREVSPQAAEEVLSWRTGYLIFDATPLADAIAEFNRYTPHKIRIRDSEVAAMGVSGKFRSNNADAFIRVLHDGFGIQARRDQDGITLVR